MAVRTGGHLKKGLEISLLERLPLIANSQNSPSLLLVHYHWPLLKDVYNDCNELSVNLQAWKFLFELDLPNRESFMGEDDQAYLKSLPDEIQVFRGYNGDQNGGISYTLNKDIAIWFSNRNGKDGKVLTAKVKKKDIVAYINDRDEQTVIITKPIQTIKVEVYTSIK